MEDGDLVEGFDESSDVVGKGHGDGGREDLLEAA